MRDVVEDLSSGPFTARLNRTLLARVLVAKRASGEVVHPSNQLVVREARRNHKERRARERQVQR